jgi:eukaryotic-like serine/threonine-protein kinase
MCGPGRACQSAIAVQTWPAHRQYWAAPPAVGYTARSVNGTIVGSYRIVDTVSVGGMGTVYRAEHTLIGRLAAVKILHPELCANRSMVNRFFNEARATTSIKHPGIVEVFDFGYMPSGHAYLIMEFLEGMPLSHRVRQRGAVSEGEAALLLRSVCIALAAAHDKGIVHRDLKPDNIFVIPDPDSVLGERTKILDFGIAKLSDLGLAGGTTKTGAVMGTPTYMSPEQCRGTGDVDHRADLYSIGCIFYELVTGRPPFISAGAGEAIGSHLFVTPEPPSRHAALSAETDALIIKLLAKPPEQRVQSAKELVSLLTLVAQQHGATALGEISHPGFYVPAPLPTPPLSSGPASGLGSGDHARFTPAMAPTTLEPAFTPSGLSSGVPASLLTQKPTTLSEAASELRQPPARSRRRLAFAILGGLAGAIGALVALGETSSSTARSAASPGIAIPAVPAAAKPQATEPRAASPSPASGAPPPSTTHSATPTTSGSASATASTPNSASASSPATAAPGSPAPSPEAPSTTTPPTQAPAASSGSSAAPDKPVTPPRPKKPRKSAGSASETKELLEQDI